MSLAVQTATAAEEVECISSWACCQHMAGSTKTTHEAITADRKYSSLLYRMQQQLRATASGTVECADGTTQHWVFVVALM
jgi:hypothetical protein